MYQTQGKIKATSINQALSTDEDKDCTTKLDQTSRKKREKQIDKTVGETQCQLKCVVQNPPMSYR